MDSTTGQPDDYAELFEQYWPMMYGIVAKAGIHKFDVEDVAMDILARFIDKDGLNYYDPDRPQGKTKFKGMLRGFTSTYVMQYRDKQMIRHRREPWKLDTPIEIKGRETTWGEVNMVEEGWIDASEVSIDIITCLKETRRILDSKSYGKRDYGLFVDLCIKNGFLEGDLNREVIRDTLGIGSSTLNVMIRELRNVLRPLLEEAGAVAKIA